jgi:hypothetical protein
LFEKLILELSEIWFDFEIIEQNIGSNIDIWRSGQLFSDKICDHLLFEDKMRFECVWKQFENNSNDWFVIKKMFY